MINTATDTRTRILDAAERLYAARGVEAVSVRAILAEAGANAALAHYYFRGREGLVREVLRRRVRPLNEQRLRLLERAEATARERRPALQAVLRAFFAPAVKLLEERPDFARLLGRLHVTADEKLRAFFLEEFGEALLRFGDALRRALPADLAGARRTCRAHFALGVMIYTLTNFADLASTGRGPADAPRGETLLREMVAFCEAGLRAPAAQRAAGRGNGGPR